MTTPMNRVIAIDGPSGAGKSTVARGVASRLGLEVLDTGAMYRAVTLAVLERGIDPGDELGCGAVAEQSRVEVGATASLDGRDVSREIRGPTVTAAVSAVSAHPSVRTVLVARQRAWADAHNGGVVEGRDIGTVVFPDAGVKVFLTASDEERARRRQRDEADSRRPVDVSVVREELDRRDLLDSTRVTSPLQAAPDALRIDTTGHTAEAVIDEIVARYQAVVGDPR